MGREVGLVVVVAAAPSADPRRPPRVLGSLHQKPCHVTDRRTVLPLARRLIPAPVSPGGSLLGKAVFPRALNQAVLRHLERVTRRTVHPRVTHLAGHHGELVLDRKHVLDERVERRREDASLRIFGAHCVEARDDLVGARGWPRVVGAKFGAEGDTIGRLRAVAALPRPCACRLAVSSIAVRVIGHDHLRVRREVAP